ncbi:E3 ubiquitin/ISG15 ligase TRIM25 isoform X2 [Trichosurus vulpecula]|uniref:E3 ubiquitin/ISG15 ligase TRIM25 isoform X2 n=1 Tax=Trichosurus vulpecula TaxID=9337 RepID=UPI00186B50F9|nr:E3 ubiquitin/ISG15 ligase TRIM25 isoform X2 [Trichosurus vulpecula]
MAEPLADKLTPLADELTCSICLDIFQQPVTTPCGHNFCSQCLDETWTVQSPHFYCPQCRARFPERPQLKKNTVLDEVVKLVQEAQKRCDLGQPRGASQDGEPLVLPPGKGSQAKDEAAGIVACDHCLQAPAAKTCFTCMASFCQEHLQPHLDNPIYQGHELQPPVGDLARRKCPEHGRLREFFCSQHGVCICSICLVGHKTCSLVALDEARTELEDKIKRKLMTICDHVSKASSALDDVRLKQHAVQETVARKMDLLKREYEEIKVLIESEEKSSLRKLKEEEKRVLDKYDHIHQVLVKKKRDIESLKEEIELLLMKSDKIAFLEKASKLHEFVIKAVYIPKNELNQDIIHSVYQNATSLKGDLKHKISKLQEKKTEEATSPDDFGKYSFCFGPTYSNREYRQLRRTPKGDKPQPKPLRNQQEKSEVTEEKQEKKPKKPAPAPAATPSLNPSGGSMTDLTKLKPALPQTTEKANALPKNSPNQKTQVLEAFLAKSRPELLQYATRVVLDYNTANYKVALSENNTVASVASATQSYPPHPKRFTYCSQVLGLQGYKSGVHYWEVELQKNTFCGIGICYGSMDRQGSDSRLGRNRSSWCVEWFNTKISTWHNDVEKNLPLTKATRIGVLLNYDDGFVIFFAITDKVNLIYKYKAEFSEALYPAFWLFSSGTTLSICPLK